jgi:hypothetical protein
VTCRPGGLKVSWAGSLRDTSSWGGANHVHGALTREHRAYILHEPPLCTCQLRTSCYTNLKRKQTKSTLQVKPAILQFNTSQYFLVSHCPAR